jgi:hypothetical protein
MSFLWHLALLSASCSVSIQLHDGFRRQLQAMVFLTSKTISQFSCFRIWVVEIAAILVEQLL